MFVLMIMIMIVMSPVGTRLYCFPLMRDWNWEIVQIVRKFPTFRSERKKVPLEVATLQVKTILVAMATKILKLATKFKLKDLSRQPGDLN